jgi:hypothetical protein
VCFSFTSCAHSIQWEGKIDKHAKGYMSSFDRFRKQICVPKAEEKFDQLQRSYRGQGYWIPELKEDVDVPTISALLPEMEKKMKWIQDQRKKLEKNDFPKASVTTPIRQLLKRLLELKKSELSTDEKEKTNSRKESLRLLSTLQHEFSLLTKRISFFTNHAFPVDHLKNRKVFDQYRENEDPDSVKIANYTFLYRKLVEDGAWNKEHTSSDIYLRTTLDTLAFELKQHDFYLSEDARYDLDFVLTRIENEMGKGKTKAVERLIEWEERTNKAYAFYKSLTDPANQKEIEISGKKTTPNRELIKEHNKATEELKEYVYTKQAEVYKYWLNQPELPRAIFVLETILLNEVGGVDGEDALERMDVARVVMNRLDKPKYLVIGKKEFIYPYLKEVTTEHNIKSERWLNALFKQGEFSFTYYYMSGVPKIFCPDMAPTAKKLRKQNIEIALRVLKEKDYPLKATRYFSRASMIGRIHMNSVWEDYVPYPERPGLLAIGQEALQKSFSSGDYSYLYSFRDPQERPFEVVQIKGDNYAIGEEKGIKLFFKHRNQHHFRYFTKE